MARYIDADLLMKELGITDPDCEKCGWGRKEFPCCMRDPDFADACFAICEAQTADVVERKRGKWEITDAFPHIVYCGVCHKRYAQTQWQVWKDGTLPRNFCPNCGAEMGERRADEESTKRTD